VTLSRRLNYNIEDHGTPRSVGRPTVPKSVMKFTVCPPVTIDYDLRGIANPQGPHMPEITTQTLVMAIQAVAAEMRALREDLASEDVDPGLEQLYEDFERAADDLEAAYDKEARTVLSLPPYNELVGE
jgi:hypothetical protein